MPVSEEAVQFDQAESEPSPLGISPTDPKYALHMGRDLACFLICRTPWRFNCIVEKVEWQVDDVTYEAKEFEWRMLREQKEGKGLKEDRVGPTKNEHSGRLMTEDDWN
jgi:hypothetical protein